MTLSPFHFVFEMVVTGLAASIRIVHVDWNCKIYLICDFRLACSALSLPSKSIGVIAYLDTT